MKKTTRLVSLMLAVIMALALFPVTGGAKQTARPLTEQERSAKIAQLTEFAAEVAEINAVYNNDLESKKHDGEFALARIIVKSSAKLSDEKAVAHAAGYNDWQVFQYETADEARAALARFKKMDKVEWAEPDGIVSIAATPGSNSFKSWGFGANHINMFEYNEWLYAMYGNSVANMPEVIVAVIDTGAAANHPFLAGRLVPGWNFVNNTNNPEDGHSHGTHVSGTIVDGTFENVKIMPIKVLSDSGAGSNLNCSLGIEYAYLHGAKVENMSLGGPCDEGTDHHLLSEAIDNAFDNGTAVVIAAGNESLDASTSCPGNVERACTVAAIGTNHALSYFSNFGDLVDVAAPGEGINSSVPGGGFESKDGTSMASPHVAAVAAQIKTANPDMNADELVSAIKGTAQNINLNNAGTGMVHLAPNLFGLNSAVNASGVHYHFSSSGNYAWTADGNSAVSGNANANNSTSVMKTELTLGLHQSVTFDYKISSEQGHDYLRVKANGTTVFETSGEHGWTSETVDIPFKGSVALTFEYSKDSTGASGSDKAWIRNFRVNKSISSAANPSGGTVEFTSTGANPWIVNDAENAAMSGNAGVHNSSSVMNASVTVKKGMIITFCYKVSAESGDNFLFKVNGSTVLTSGTTDGFVKYEYSAPSSGTLALSFEFKKNASGSSGDDCALVKSFDFYHSFASAINAGDADLPFNNNEAEFPWLPMKDYVTSTNWYEAGTSSYLTLDLPMHAGETLSFRYRTSSVDGYDYFRFYVDGAMQTELSGQTNWRTFTFTATADKTYSFKWAYEKHALDLSMFVGAEDAAYVDDVEYSGTTALLPGDSDNSGAVNVADALLALRYAMGLINASELNTQAADMDGNGSITVADAITILRMALGLR